MNYAYLINGQIQKISCLLNKLNAIHCVKLRE